MVRVETSSAQLAPNSKTPTMLSVLKRSDTDALICLTATPAPNELAQRLSQGHPFRVAAVVTFPDAYWAEDLAARLTEKRVGQQLVRRFAERRHPEDLGALGRARRVRTAKRSTTRKETQAHH